jgi:hypothetical protein
VSESLLIVKENKSFSQRREERQEQQNQVVFRSLRSLRLGERIAFFLRTSHSSLGMKRGQVQLMYYVPGNDSHHRIFP